MAKKFNKQIKEFPRAISFGKLLGPSFIILALGLGSGEVILWPYLTANYGLGLAWGALLGITFQYFINMEIERYALIKGESVFVGFAKLFKWAPAWFIFSTFVGFGLPGIIAASAQVVAALLGWESFKWLAMGLLIVVGIILSVGKTVYGLMEKTTKTIIIVGVPFIFLLVLFLAKGSDAVWLFKGLVGWGEGFYFLPAGIGLATFLAAFAYAGAGGNLNLTQSIYVKEKGYGMGKYAQKITGLFRHGGAQKIKLTGEDFVLTEINLKHFREWWRKINLEHLLVFWLIGLAAMCLLMLLAYSSTFGQADNSQGISFVINEAIAIGRQLAPGAGLFFLALVGVMLFQTQLGITDSTSRIMAENWALKKTAQRQETVNLSKIYYWFVWAQIAFGLLLFLFDFYEPRLLIVAGAMLNAVAMFVHVGLTQILNWRTLPPVLRPRRWRRVVMAGIFLFLGVFSAITLLSYL